MLHFLQTHPSVFIIAATFIIIIMIFTCFVKKPDQENKIEQMDNDNNEYVEMEEISSSSRPDEPDNGPTLQLSKKIYDKPLVHKFPAIPESPPPQDCIISEALPDVTNPGTSGVVYREPRVSNHENRVSVSDVYRHGSYINFEDEFDSFDEFRKSTAFLRVTMNMGSTENQIYPVLM